MYCYLDVYYKKYFRNIDRSVDAFHLKKCMSIVVSVRELNNFTEMIKNIEMLMTKDIARLPFRLFSNARRPCVNVQLKLPIVQFI